MRSFLGVIICAVPALGGAAATAQTPSAPSAPSVRSVFVDADGDRIPDHMGDTVVVEGVVTSEPLVIGRSATLANFQDHTRGALLFSRDTTALSGLSAGDSIRARGRVGQYRGVEQLWLESYSLLGRTAVPEPLDVLVSELHGEHRSGMLVRVEGTLTATKSPEGWLTAVIQDRTGSIPVHISALWLSDPEFTERVRRGGKTAVVGVAAQRTFSDPPVDGYELFPRDPDDFEIAPTPPYRLMAAGAALLVMIALLLWRRVAARRASKFEHLAHALEASRDELQAREERFRSLVENAADIISILDHDGRFLYSSPSVERALGWEADDLVGKPADGFVHPADRRKARALFATIVSAPGAIGEADLRCRAADGEWHDLEVVAANRLDDPAVHGIVCNTRDVTRHRALEQRLRQSDRLEAVGRLAGGIAHDFNNILTVLRGHADLALEGMDGSVAGRADVEQIAHSVDRAAQITRQLLAFTRQQVRQSRVVAVSDIVRGMMPMVHRLIGEDLRMDLALDSGADWVEADPAQLEQIILNLCINARDAMPGGGWIRIEVAASEITAADADEHPYRVQPGRYVRLTVADDGTGMEQEVLRRIFEPFFTTKEPGKGTGLGLATVYGIVKQSDGYIWAESEAGRGTRFDIRLPLVAPPVELDAPAIAGPPPVTKSDADVGRVLVVEDERAVRLLAARVLRKRGYHVLEAQDSAEALQLVCDEQEIDLLITDMVMPGMNGIKLAARVAESFPHAAVIVMSGYSQDEIVLEDRSVPFEFLEKPFAPDQLLSTVRSVLRQRAEVS